MFLYKNIFTAFNKIFCLYRKKKLVNFFDKAIDEIDFKMKCQMVSLNNSTSILNKNINFKFGKNKLQFSHKFDFSLLRLYLAE